MVNLFFHVARREYSSCCESALVVAESVFVGYELFPMVLGLGTLVSGSDDVLVVCLVFATVLYGFWVRFAY